MTMKQLRARLGFGPIESLNEVPDLSACDYTTVAIDGKTLSDYLSYYDRLRSYVQHEDDLINTRLTWSLTIHGFLFATYGILLGKVSEVLIEISKASPRNNQLLIYTVTAILLFQLPICALGAWVGRVSYEAILAAHHALQHLRVIAHEGGALAHTPTEANLADNSYVRLPKIVGGGVHGETKVAGARRYYLTLPTWMMTVWIVLGSVSILLAIVLIFFPSVLSRITRQPTQKENSIFRLVHTGEAQMDILSLPTRLV